MKYFFNNFALAGYLTTSHFSTRRTRVRFYANLAVDSVGLKNVFIPYTDAENFLCGCIAKVVDIFPNLPIVGYETEQEIAKLQTWNFEPLGSLRVF